MIMQIFIKPIVYNLMQKEQIYIEFLYLIRGVKYQLIVLYYSE